MPAGQPPVAQEPREQDDAVGNEPGERAGVLASPGEDEREDDRDVEAEWDAERVVRPDRRALLGGIGASIGGTAAKPYTDVSDPLRRRLHQRQSQSDRQEEVPPPAVAADDEEKESRDEQEHAP